MGPIYYKQSCLTASGHHTTTVGDINYIRSILVFYDGEEKKKYKSNNSFFNSSDVLQCLFNSRYVCLEPVFWLNAPSHCPSALCLFRPARKSTSLCFKYLEEQCTVDWEMVRGLLSAMIFWCKMPFRERFAIMVPFCPMQAAQ